MKQSMHSGADKNIFIRARELRSIPTHAEDILWGYLKTKPLNYKFRRQHPYSIYILDFYCHLLQLVIEIDGSIHNLEEIRKHDLERQSLLEDNGLTVIRFTNEAVLQDYKAVISTIENIIKDRSSRIKKND